MECIRRFSVSSGFLSISWTYRCRLTVDLSVDVGVGEGIEVDVHVYVDVEINAILVAVVERCAYVLRKGVGIHVDFRWMLFVLRPTTLTVG